MDSRLCLLWILHYLETIKLNLEKNRIFAILKYNTIIDMKRNIITLIIFVIGTLIITSCSLKVNKDITKFYPPQFPDSTFKLYYGSNETPNDAEIIGTLSIKDAGATLNCDSATVFDLAKIEAGQSGGNALLITKHTRPSIFGSSCHQISGFILKIPDTIGDRDLFLGVVSSSDTSIVKDTSVNKMVKFELPRYLPRAIFSLDGGYGWRTAKISPDLNYEEREFMEHLMSDLLGIYQLLTFLKIVMV